MTRSFEIIGKFDCESDCQHLLYVPPPGKPTYRQTRLYVIDFDGDADGLEAFVQEVLLDPISQELRGGDSPAFDGHAFVLEYGMKGGALDLEKEAILAYYRALERPGFVIQRLTLRTRIYVFGTLAQPALFVRDICNPAIHTWEVRAAA